MKDAHVPFFDRHNNKNNLHLPSKLSFKYLTKESSFTNGHSVRVLIRTIHDGEILSYLH